MFAANYNFFQVLLKKIAILYLYYFVFCIDKKINYFDPGVQGEHKIRRGFEPIRTSSFHYVKENDFRNAIIEFCEKEEVEINRYLKACERYTPFNKEYKI